MVTESIKRIGTVFSTQDDSVEASASSIYLRAATLGFVCGLRSMLPLALLNWNGSREAEAALEAELIPASPLPRLLTTFLAGGELIGDKLPFIPSRLSPGPFIGRLAIGALVGGQLSYRFKRSPVIGALLGAASAGVAATCGATLRTQLAKKTRIPDFIVAIAEDTLAISLGISALQKQ